MEKKVNSKLAPKITVFILILLIIAAPVSMHVYAASYFSGGTIHLIQTSHSDIGWADGPSYEIGEDNTIIDNAMTMFGQSSGFKYVSEDMLHFKQFIDNRSQAQVDALKARVNAGTYEFGAAYASPYEELLSGEGMARQFYFGRKWFKELFPGQDAKVYYAVDPPERALQMSQLLQKAGIPYEFTSRYYGRVPGVPDNSLVKWSSPDGSSTLVFAYSHYGRLGYSSEVDMSSAASIKNYVDSWESYYSSHNLPKQLIMLWETDDRNAVNYSSQISNWNSWASANGYPAMKYSTMKEAMDAIAGGNLASVDTTSGTRPNLWLYEASPTNHWAASYQRDGSIQASAAEAFCTFRSMLEGNYNNYPQDSLKQVWQDLVWACHGWARQDTVDSFLNTYKNARDTAKAQLDTALNWIAKKINTQAIGTPLIVYNALSWQRTDVVITDLPAGAPSPFTLKDALGNTIPYQLLPENKMVFVAANVPSMGYKTFYLVSGGSTPGDGPAKNTIWNSTYVNNYYQITPVSGGVSSIYDKETAKELLDTTKFKGGEILLMDSGSGMGAGEFQTFPYVLNTVLDRSTTHGLTWTCTEDGPVRRAYETNYTFTSFIYRLKVNIYSGIKRIDFEPSLINWNGANHREVRMMFPLISTTKDVAFDAPFAISKVGTSEVDTSYFGWGAGHQPRETQNFIYGGGNGFGVTLGSSVAPIDYMDPTANVSTGAQDIGCGADGSIVYTAMDSSADGGKIYKWTGGSWSEVGGAAYRIAVAKDGHLWVINKGGMIWENEGSGWISRGSGAQDIGCGADGTIAYTATDSGPDGGKIYKWTGSTWVEVGGLAVSISVANDGHLWVINKGGAILENEGSSWVTRGSGAQDIGCGANGVIAYTAVDSSPDGGKIYKWTGGGWNEFGGAATRINVDKDGHLWVVNEGGGVFENTGTGWTPYLSASSSQTILQPILLATRDSCAGSYYWSQAGTHDYRFTLYSHTQGYQNGYRTGIQFNNPLMGVAPGAKDAGASLSESMSFASVSQVNVIISAIKRADNDSKVVVRLYDIEGIDSMSTFQFVNSLQSAMKASLIEEDGASLSVNGNSVSLPVGHNGIETIKLGVGMTIPTPTPTPTPTPQSNLALNKPVSASGEYSSSYSAAKAVDGIAAGLENTKWNTASGQVEPHWLKVDLGQNYNITRYIVKHAGYNNIEQSGYNTRDFKFQTSIDGTNWTDVDTVTGNTTGLTDRPVSASGRYARLYITDASVTDSYARIYEFEVYGSGSIVTPTPTPSVISTPTATATPSSSPSLPDKGWWKFDETNGTLAADSSGNGYTGTVSGATWTSGHLNNALSFNGISDYVLVGNYPKPSTTATYTAWVYANSVSNNWASIVKNWGDINSGQVHLGINGITSKLGVYVTQSNGTAVNCSEGINFPTGSWQHVAVVADGSYIRLYRNGSQVASVAYNGTLKPGFNALGIGVKPSDAGNGPDSTNPGYWNGRIDDVRVYARALSAQEITTLAGQ